MLLVDIAADRLEAVDGGVVTTLMGANRKVFTSK